jgi:hypothetical protein
VDGVGNELLAICQHLDLVRLAARCVAGQDQLAAGDLRELHLGPVQSQPLGRLADTEWRISKPPDGQTVDGLDCVGVTHVDVDGRRTTGQQARAALGISGQPCRHRATTLPAVRSGRLTAETDRDRLKVPQLKLGRDLAEDERTRSAHARLPATASTVPSRSAVTIRSPRRSATEMALSTCA